MKEGKIVGVRFRAKAERLFILNGGKRAEKGWPLTALGSNWEIPITAWPMYVFDVCTWQRVCQEVSRFKGRFVVD